MRTTNKADAKFNVSDKFKKRALELLNESQAMQFAEGLRLNRSASVVFAREAKRLSAKYGPDDPRTVEMTVRYEASETAKADLFARFVDVMTPPTTAKEGWAVDGFVRTADGRPVGELTVAPCDKAGTPVKGLGSATTDARGFFSIKLDKLPDTPPSEVFMRAFKGRTPLESREVRLIPQDGATERVEIILGDRSDGGKPPEPTKPGTGTATPPIVVAPTPTEKPETGATPAPDKPAGTSTTTPPDRPGSTGTIKPTDAGATIPVKPSTTAAPTVRPSTIIAKPATPAIAKRKSTAGKAKQVKSTTKSKAPGAKATKTRATKASTSKTRKAAPKTKRPTKKTGKKK